MNYSVLMSVYAKERAEFFEQSLCSIFGQTLKTDDFVLVCDGPLNDSLNPIIDRFQKEYPNIFHVYRKQKQEGLGSALNYGLTFCKNDFILRADSDDVSLPTRAERSLSALMSGYDVVSSTVSLFNESIDNVFGQRVLPETHEKIVAFAKKRCPFNHPAVAFRKSSVLSAGGYQSLLYREDWYLWVRMIQHGSKCYNIPTPLVMMRENGGTLKRRKNQTAYASQKRLLKYMKQTHFISSKEYLLNSFIYACQRYAPSWFVSWFYRKKLHKKDAQ